MAGGIDSLESIPGLRKRLQIRALACGQIFEVDEKIYYPPTLIFVSCLTVTNLVSSYKNNIKRYSC
jgi:hypothetical protein